MRRRATTAERVQQVGKERCDHAGMNIEARTKSATGPIIRRNREGPGMMATAHMREYGRMLPNVYPLFLIGHSMASPKKGKGTGGVDVAVVVVIPLAFIVVRAVLPTGAHGNIWMGRGGLSGRGTNAPRRLVMMKCLTADIAERGRFGTAQRRRGAPQRNQVIRPHMGPCQMATADQGRAVPATMMDMLLEDKAMKATAADLTLGVGRPSAAEALAALPPCQSGCTHRRGCISRTLAAGTAGRQHVREILEKKPLMKEECMAMAAPANMVLPSLEFEGDIRRLGATLSSAGTETSEEAEGRLPADLWGTGKIRLALAQFGGAPTRLGRIGAVTVQEARDRRRSLRRHVFARPAWIVISPTLLRGRQRGRGSTANHRGRLQPSGLQRYASGSPLAPASPPLDHMEAAAEMAARRTSIVRMRRPWTPRGRPQPALHGTRGTSTRPTTRVA